MPSVVRRVLLHEDGPALWPEHKPLEEILALQKTTPSTIWEGTYQGRPTAPGGTIFRRSWWDGKNRLDVDDPQWANKCLARWCSWDTAMKDDSTAAYTSCTVGELLPNYQLFIRQVWRDRLEFPALADAVRSIASRWNYDGKLRNVLIEDKASGISAFQTLSLQAEDWLKGILVAFQPHGDKETRANQAAVWCRNDMVILPRPGPTWLLDFEDELFGFPQSTYKDQVDSFTQLILWLENLLAEGMRARGEGHGS